MSGVSKPRHFVRITRKIHSDLQMWLTFLHEFNGTKKLEWESDSDFKFYSDSSGANGCGVVFGTSWSYLCWPLEWNMDIKKHITFLVCPYSFGFFYFWGQSICKIKNYYCMLTI